MSRSPLLLKGNNAIIKAQWVILLLSILTSCHVNSDYINREKDKNDGEVVLTAFYQILKSRDYEKIDTLVSEELLRALSKEKLMKIFKTTNEKLGELQSVKIVSWETRVRVGTDAKAEYFFVYQNQYEKK